MRLPLLTNALAFATTAAVAASSLDTTHQLNARKSSITPITVKGNAFFKGNDRFYIRGVDYQPGGSSKVVDPLADTSLCKRDIPKFKSLGLNTIRIYSIDNTANHDACMSLLADAGIYVVFDVNTPKYSINRADPAMSYNYAYLNSVFNTVEMFAKYDNTLAFFSGNEVINKGDNSDCAPFVKAVTRDIRAYLKERKLRQVPVGYSAADVNTNRREMALYMNCGTDEERSDLFAFNDYSWCDPSSFSVSGWNQKVKNFTGYGLPLFLSEYGCNTNKREFNEIAALYSSKMTPVYSGGLVYEYSQEPSNYGLVDIKKGGSVVELEDFTTLQKALKKTPHPTGLGGYNATGGSNPCPPRDPPNWDVDPDEPLPPMPKNARQYFTDGPGKPPGLKGPGSQWTKPGGKDGSAPSEDDDESLDPSRSSSRGSIKKSAGVQSQVHSNASLFLFLYGIIAVVL